MKTHFFEEHPFLICSEHQTKPIHKFSCFVPQNNPHFVNRLNYEGNSDGRTKPRLELHFATKLYLKGFPTLYLSICPNVSK